MNYWINTISRDHVRRGVEGGFTQANHGKDTVLKRLKVGELSFIKDKTHWGYMFRFGLFKIPEANFKLIRKAMS